MTTSKGYDAGKMKFLNKKESTYEFIGRTKKNYGIQGYVNKLDSEPNSSNTISVSQVGAVHSQLRKNKWYSSQNMFVLTPKNDLMINLFVVASIDRVLSEYGGYSSYPTLVKLRKHKIKLPSKNGKIDFNFMEAFIAELDAQRIAELDAYLTLAGLKNYELTDKEKYALEKYRSINWNDYNLYDLFDVRSYKKRFDANKININEKGKHPYVVRTAYNNGIRAYINEDERYLNPGNTISFGQDTATMWYQEKPYFTGDKIKILAPKFEEFKKENAHFIITVMSKPFQKFSWGASSFSVKVINSQKIKLPVDKNGEIDFNYMEHLTQAIKKLVIKDVVKYSDRKLETTKEVLKYTR